MVSPLIFEPEQDGMIIRFCVQNKESVLPIEKDPANNEFSLSAGQYAYSITGITDITTLRNIQNLCKGPFFPKKGAPKRKNSCILQVFTTSFWGNTALPDRGKFSAVLFH